MMIESALCQVNLTGGLPASSSAHRHRRLPAACRSVQLPCLLWQSGVYLQMATVRAYVAPSPWRRHGNR